MGDTPSRQSSPATLGTHLTPSFHTYSKVDANEEDFPALVGLAVTSISDLLFRPESDDDKADSKMLQAMMKML